MHKIVGHRVDALHIELEEPLEATVGTIQVELRVVNGARASARRDIADVIKSLRGGTRTTEEIDRELAEDRADRGL